MASNSSTAATMAPPSNPCCTEWQAKCVELSKGRTYLRDGTKILKRKVRSLETDNLNLQKALEVLEEEKGKEASFRTSLEHEVAALKSKICSNETDVNCKNKELEKETLTLRESVSEKDGEIEQLKKLLAEEKSGSVKGKKVSPSEKKKVAELQKNLKSEKSRADEACKLADAAKRKSEEDKNLVETLHSEVKTITQKFEETNKLFETEKQKVIAVNKKVEEEKAKAKELLRIAEVNEKKVTDEKSHSNNLSMMLEVEKEKVEKLRNELQDFMSNEKSALSSQLNELGKNLELEKDKVAMQKKCADVEKFEKNEDRKAAETSMKKAIEEKRRADEFLQDLQSTRQIIEHLQQELTMVNQMLKAVRLVSAKEKQRADDLNLKSKEQQRIAAENEKKAMKEESRCKEMILELENARQKVRDVEDKLCEVEQSRDLAGLSSTPPDLLLKEQVAKVSLLQEHLKFEKKRVKHYKEVANLEKELKSTSQQELTKVKQDFQSLLYQMDMLSDTFGARNHINKKRRLNAESLELPDRTPDCSLPQIDFRCDAEHRPSSLSSRDTPYHLKPDTRLVDAEQLMESPAGMKINLDPLLGGSHGDILAHSALNFNTASFSDEQLLGSQERAAGSLTTLTGMRTKDTVPRTTIARWSDGEQNSINLVELDSGHVKKRRKIVDEAELVRCVLSEGRNINQDAEINLCGLGKVLVQPLEKQMRKVNLLVNSNNADSCGNFNLSGEKNKSTNELQVALQQVDYSTVLMEMDKVKFSSSTTVNGKEISQANDSHRSGLAVPDQDGLVSFEQQVNCNFMKLLDLDDPIAEEHFRMALECPMSPTLPDIDQHEFDKEFDMQNLGMPVSNNPTDSNGELHKIPKFCVVFPDMEDIGCITRIFRTTTTCMVRLRSPLQTHWLVEDILLALVSEQHLVSREMTCVFFSLLLLNFAGASCTKSLNFQSLLSDTLCANLQSVLLNVETRHLFAKICCLHDLLSLSESFLLHKKILLRSSLTSDTRYCVGSNIEILHQGVKNVLHPSLASTNMVVAGSVVLASISVAAGLVDSICEFSLKVIRTRRAESADCSLTLMILHTFAYVCGDEYFTIMNHHSLMEAVKVIVASFECSLAISGNIQPDDGTLHHCYPCEKCPFTESCICLDDVSSKLMEEMQECIKPRKQADSFDSSCLVAILSALELLATHMNWGWVCDKIVSKLFEMQESCDPESNTSTAVVALLGDLGRLGVETGGYDDPGVKSIVQQLSAKLHRTSSLKYNTFSMAIVHSLTQLYPNGAEGFLKNNEVEESVKGAHSTSGTATSDIRRTMFSSLSGKLTSALHNSVIPRHNCLVFPSLKMM